MTQEFEKHPIIYSERDSFHRWLPNAEIESITDIRSVPGVALDLFEDRSKCYISPLTYKPESFLGIYKIRHSDGSVSWAARQTKITMSDLKGHAVDINNNHLTFEESSYLVDLSPTQNIASYSYLIRDYCNHPFFRSKPFQEWVKTEDEYLRIGLAQRSTFTLNALSQMFYNIPLYSSDHFLTSPDDEKIKPVKIMWQKLVEQGLAYKLKTNNDRYVFTQDHGLINQYLPSVNWNPNL